MNRPKQPTLTSAEQTALIEAIERAHPRVAIVVTLMARMGLRLNEARLCTWSWIHDLNTNVPTLAIPDDATKTKWPRTLPIPADVAAKLRKLIATQHLGPPVAFPQDWPLVLNRWGKPPTKRYIQNVVKYAALETIGRGIRCHTLRHTFATTLLANSNLRVTQLALGHRSIKSTQVYTHPQLSDLRAAMEHTPPRQPENP